MSFVKNLLIILMAMTLFAHPSFAATESNWQSTKEGRVRLISSTTAIGQTDKLLAGVEFDLNPGWHIYWRNPGDAGLPPHFDFKKSENVDNVTVLWPYPSRFTLDEIITIGYTDRVIFPIAVDVRNKTGKVVLDLNVDYLICKNVCLPRKAHLSMQVTPGAATPSPYHDSILSFKKRVPDQSSNADIQVRGVYLVDPVTLQVQISGKELDPDETELYVETPAEITTGVPDLVPGDPGLIVFNVPVGDLGKKNPVGRQITVTVVSDGKAVEAKKKIELAPQNSILFEESFASIWLMIAFAFMGGVILNLMPCVLPILSLKVLKVVNHAGESPRIIRQGFLFVCLGIMVSFLSFALIAIGLRETGLSIGWGIQFQHPGFLIFLIAILLVFAGSLWGLFEIQLPQIVLDRFHRLGRDKDRKIENFFTGAFATLMATPCTAPFLGAAVGFALAASAPIILLVFMMIGLGFSLPYLMVAAWPRSVSFIPKPGRWMGYVRQTLALLLLGSGVWLVSVLNNQMGSSQTLVVCSILAMAVALMTAIPLLKQRFQKWAQLLFLPLLFFLFTVPPMVNHESITQEQKAYWQQFAPRLIERHVDQGRVVFVDITADWCLTCKVNKAIALNRMEVYKWMVDNKVVAMRGDWTNPNETIAEFLRQNQRAGIPFNIVYGPGAPQGIVLPELLTPERVINAMEQAR